MKRIFAILITALVIGGVVYWLNKPPSQTATTSEPMVAVTVPNLSEDEVAGETLFNDNCGVCHGNNASGVDGAGPPLVHIIYEPNHHGDPAFQLAVKNGVRAHHWNFGNMPPVANVSENEVTKVISYVRALQRANGIK